MSIKSTSLSAVRKIHLLSTLLLFIFIFATASSAFAQRDEFSQDRIWLMLTDNFWQNSIKQSDGSILIPTGDVLIDRAVRQVGADRIVPMFTHDPISLKNPTFFSTNLYLHYKIVWDFSSIKQDPEKLVDFIQLSPSVRETDVIYLKHASLTPNDWGLSSRNLWFLDSVKVRTAWDSQQGNSSILAVTIDTGVDYNHEDLFPNIRTNPLEDVNSDGRFTSTDNNSNDADGNGFIDDVIGWDFVSHSYTEISGATAATGEDYGPRDNTPYDVHGHGTHVMGSIAARTNNSLGVPAASFNVQTLSLRAGFAYISGGQLQGSGYDDDFSPAIQYAVNRGARIISISFGGTSQSTAYQSAINYARANNCLVFAAAGNENTSSVRYPANYTGVIAVAALTTGNVKASFSNYGSWIDISAPGTDIWSTMVVNTYNPSAYVAWDGTSMATPTAASVAALVLSGNPSLTDDQLESTILTTATNINTLNPSYVNQLGSGIVNAQAAVATLRPVNVSYPNGGESLMIGTTATIQWTYQPTVTNVRIELNRNFPAGAWETIISSTPSNGSYAWTVTSPATTTARIRIINTANSSQADTSNANFSIATVPISLAEYFEGTFPNTNWTNLGRWAQYLYSSNRSARLNYYSLSNVGSTDTLIAPVLNLSGQTGTQLRFSTSYINYQTYYDSLYVLARIGNGAWTSLWRQGGLQLANRTASRDPTAWRANQIVLPPEFLVNGVQFAFVGYNGYGDNLYIDSVYTFNATPSISVLSPNGGESWGTNLNQTITWSSVSITGNVSIDINRSYPTGSWETIFTNIANDGNEVWNVTGPTSSSARIRVRSVSMVPEVSDFSDANFTIFTPPPALTLTVPNGGESYVVGGSIPITWTSQSITGNVAIDLNRNYPTGMWETLFSSTANDGNENWVVTTPISSAARMRVRTISMSPQVLDESNANFIITTGPQVFNSTTVPVAITDNTTSYAYITIPNYLQITDVNCLIDITHTYDGDLEIHLISPQNTDVLLVNNRGGSGDNFTQTRFDDEAATAITAGTAPFTGSFRPEGLLSSFDTQNGQGQWTLVVMDQAGGDVGTINQFTLQITGLSTYTVSGNVTALTGGTPLETVQITIGSQQTFTNALGNYSVNVEPNVHALNAQKSGWNNYSTSLNVSGNLVHNFQMNRPIAQINPLSAITSIEVPDSAFFTITMTNIGDGPMNWTAQLNPTTGPTHETSASISSSLLTDGLLVKALTGPVVALSKVATGGQFNEGIGSGALSTDDTDDPDTGTWLFTQNSGLLGVGQTMDYDVRYAPLAGDPSSLQTANLVINWRNDQTTTIPLSVNVNAQELPGAITFPNGGETLFVGVTTNFQWTPNPVVTTVMIEINRSYPSGLWETIALETANSGTHLWVPSLPTTNAARIRITDVNYPSRTVTSAANFSIQSPQITAILRPNGGETFVIGRPDSIKWTTNAPDSPVIIEINRSFPTGSWATLFSSTPNDGFQIWNPSGIQTNAARIRIRFVGGIGNQIQSAANFNIQSATLTLTSHNVVDTLYVGDLDTIRWTSSNITGNIRLLANYNYPSGFWQEIAPAIPHQWSSYPYQVTMPGVVRFAIQSLDYPAVTDTTDANVTVLQRSLQLTFPNGGEQFFMYQPIVLTWVSNFATDIALGFSPAGLNPDSLEVLPGAESVSIGVGTGSFAWVPNRTTMNGMIYILDWNYALEDWSDASFTVQHGSLTVTRPNGGENIRLGRPDTIRWVSNLTGNVRIELARNGVLPYELIAVSVPAVQQQFVWTPTGTTSSNSYIIITHNTTGQTDQSDNPFNLTDSVLELLRPLGGEVYYIGVTDSIIWSAVDLAGNVTIEMQNSPLSTWSPITSVSATAENFYRWRPLGPATTQARIRISNVGVSALTDSSSNPFSILYYPWSVDGYVARNQMANRQVQWIPDVPFDPQTNGMSPLGVIFPAQVGNFQNPDSILVVYRNFSDTDEIPPSQTIDRIWTITPNSQNFRNATLTLRFTSSQLPSGIPNPTTANPPLGAIMSEDGGSSWIFVPGGSVDNDTTPNTYKMTIPNVNHFSDWAMTNTGIQPVFTTHNSTDTLYIGDTTEFRWSNLMRGGSVTIQVNRSYPSGTWETLFSGTPNDSMQTWTVDGNESSNARFRIYSNWFSTDGDTTNANVVIRYKTPAAPANVTVTISGNSMDLAWARVDTATNGDDMIIHGYKVYYMDTFSYSGTWTLLTTINDRADTTHTDANVMNTYSTRYYMIKAYVGGTTSSSSYPIHIRRREE